MTDKPIYRVNEIMDTKDGSHTLRVMADTFDDKDALAILDALRNTYKAKGRRFLVTRLETYGEVYVKW